MGRGFALIIILSLALLAFYWFGEPKNLSREELLTAEMLETLRGKVYSTPNPSPFEDFFIDNKGNLYGIEPGIEDESATEVIGKIEELKDSDEEVEIKGEIEEGVEDYGNKRIRIKDIKKADEQSGPEELTGAEEVGQEESSVQGSIDCQNQGGKTEIKKICTFPNGEECELDDLLNGRCP